MITNNILAVALLSTIAGASLIPEETTLQTDVSGGKSSLHADTLNTDGKDVSNGANTWTGSIRKLLDVNTTDGVSGAVTGAMKTTGTIFRRMKIPVFTDYKRLDNWAGT